MREEAAREFGNVAATTGTGAVVTDSNTNAEPEEEAPGRRADHGADDGGTACGGGEDGA